MMLPELGVDQFLSPWLTRARILAAAFGGEVGVAGPTMRAYRSAEAVIAFSTLIRMDSTATFCPQPTT